MQIDCLHPYISLSIEPQGQIKVCCVASTAIVGADEVKSLEEVFEHPNIKTTRESLIAGRWPSTCNRCKRVEAAGLGNSKRMRYSESLTGYSEYPAWMSKIGSNQFIELADLTINFSNVCNLACSMCSSNFSTKWIKKEKDFFSKYQIEDYQNYFTQMNSTWKISDHLLGSILKACSSLKKLRVKGGEPFAEKRFVPFVEKLLASHQNPQGIEISIQSNGTFISEDFLNACQNTFLDFGISIDGIYKTYEWMRGYPFEKILANINYYGNHESVDELYLDFAITAFNYQNIPDFIRFFLERRSSLRKLKRLTFFNVADEPWNDPLSQALELRQRVWDETAALVKENGDFFDSPENLEAILNAPQSVDPKSFKFRREFMNQVRGFEI